MSAKVKNHQMQSAPFISGVGTALPDNYVSQEELTGALRQFWMQRFGDVSRFDRLQGALGIQGRYLALPMVDYYALDSFAKGNDAWLRIAPELAAKASRTALERAGLEPRDIDHIFFVTVTGIATPTIDVALSNQLGMRRDLKRTPIFGLGCGAGAAGLARTADYVRGFSRETAMLVSVELCSLTLQRDDLSAANIIASGLFGDGAAAVVVSGGDRTEKFNAAGYRHALDTLSGYAAHHRMGPCRRRVQDRAVPSSYATGAEQHHSRGRRVPRSQLI